MSDVELATAPASPEPELEPPVQCRAVVACRIDGERVQAGELVSVSREAARRLFAAGLIAIVG